MLSSPERTSLTPDTVEVTSSEFILDALIYHFETIEHRNEFPSEYQCFKAHCSCWKYKKAKFRTMLLLCKRVLKQNVIMKNGRLFMDSNYYEMVDEARQDGTIMKSPSGRVFHRPDESSSLISGQNGDISFVSGNKEEESSVKNLSSIDKISENHDENSAKEDESSLVKIITTRDESTSLADQDESSSLVKISSNQDELSLLAETSS